MKVFGITGWKNSGKTGLMERLVSEISARGVVVSTVKHAHHAFDVDHPGRDSYRHREAGAREVVLASRKRVAVMTELRGEAEPELDELLTRLGPCDLVLVEGYKRQRHPKIECFRAEAGHDLIAKQDDTILAVASDCPVDVAVPVLELDDTKAIANFVMAHVGLS
ncbi:molybdopterin-guanine dinucleotide biosynthesis protein B [Sagittula sp. NFXS13]|uniref:molybdopterin-guanine dinucleotide biosynthesis protein B n=1 Tax=Sagittula sp. NFXS13 TaxID=2819095 RepID=UPI0032DF4BE4